MNPASGPQSPQITPKSGNSIKFSIIYQNLGEFTKISRISDFLWFWQNSTFPARIYPSRRYVFPYVFQHLGRFDEHRCAPCVFFAFSRNSVKLLISVENYGISGNFVDFSVFYDFCGFHVNHASESVIFLRNYWCFCDLLVFAKIIIFTQKMEISKNLSVSMFYVFYWKSWILRKMGPRAPKSPKKG